MRVPCDVGRSKLTLARCKYYGDICDMRDPKLGSFGVKIGSVTGGARGRERLITIKNCPEW